MLQFIIGRKFPWNSGFLREKDDVQAHKKTQLAQVSKIKKELQESGWELVKLKQPIKKTEYVIITKCGKRVDTSYHSIAHYTRHGGSIDSLWVKIMANNPANKGFNKKTPFLKKL